MTLDDIFLTWKKFKTRRKAILEHEQRRLLVEEMALTCTSFASLYDGRGDTAEANVLRDAADLIRACLEDR